MPEEHSKESLHAALLVYEKTNLNTDSTVLRMAIGSMQEKIAEQAYEADSIDETDNLRQEYTELGLEILAVPIINDVSLLKETETLSKDEIIDRYAFASGANLGVLALSVESSTLEQFMIVINSPEEANQKKGVLKAYTGYSEYLKALKYFRELRGDNFPFSLDVKFALPSDRARIGWSIEGGEGDEYEDES